MDTLNRNADRPSSVGPKPGHVPDIQQQRSSLVRLFSRLSGRSVNLTAGSEPLVVDLVGPDAGVHWVVTVLSALGVFATTNLPAAGGMPTAGLFLVPAETTPVENLTDAQNSWNINARAVPIPCVWTSQALGAGKGFGFVCQAQLWQPLIVPGGWTIRFMSNINAGTATPGPGAGSSATVQAWGALERDAN